MSRTIYMRMIMLFLAILGLSLGTSTSFAEPIWQPWSMGREDIEFAIISEIGDTQVTFPNALETGFNGAYGIPEPDINRIGWGQTFVVPTPRQLVGVQLRISSFRADPPVGTFELAISEFDTIYNIQTNELVSINVSAAPFNFPLGSDVPVTTFDLSDSGVMLDSTETYLLSLRWLGGPGFPQIAFYAATDIYPGGNSYFLTPQVIPEPSSLAMGGTAMLLGLGYARRRHSRNAVA